MTASSRRWGWLKEKGDFSVFLALRAPSHTLSNSLKNKKKKGKRPWVGLVWKHYSSVISYIYGGETILTIHPYDRFRVNDGCLLFLLILIILAQV